MVKKRGGIRKSSKKETKRNRFLKRLPGILWFILGIVITLWTLLWLLVSLNSNDFGSVISVILFGIGFYSMIAFIVGTLIYYITKFIRRVKKKKHKKQIKKKPIKKKKVKKAPVKKKITKKKPSKKKK
jgi:amino acid transporter